MNYSLFDTGSGFDVYKYYNPNSGNIENKFHEWGTITFVSDQIEYYNLPLELPGYSDKIAGCCNNGRSYFMLGVNGSKQVYARAYASIKISYALWY